MRGRGVGDFSCVDGVVDDSADGIDPACESCAEVDGSFEGEFHPGTQIGVISDLACQGEETRGQTIERGPSIGTFRRVVGGLVNREIPVRDELVRNRFLGREVLIDRASRNFLRRGL